MRERVSEFFWLPSEGFILGRHIIKLEEQLLKGERVRNNTE